MAMPVKVGQYQKADKTRLAQHFKLSFPWPGWIE
jgi:hypothetical protein